MPSFLNDSPIVFNFDSNRMPLYRLATEGIRSVLALRLLGLLLIIVLAFQIVYLNHIHRILDKKTYLPPFVFILIATSFNAHHWLHPALFAAVFLIITIGRVFSSGRKKQAFSNYFDAGLFVAIASLFYFPSIFFMFFVLGGLLVLRPFRWREWVISFLGISTPYALIVGYFYIFDINVLERFEMLCETFMLQKQLYPKGDFAILFYAITFLISMFAILHVVFRARTSVLGRKYFFLLLWCVITTIITYGIVLSAFLELLVIFSIPLSLIISHYLLSIKRWIFVEFIFLSWVVLFLLMQIY